MTFEDFWARWPHKVGKQAARKAWDKLGMIDRTDALDSATDWFTDWRKKNASASPIHASTYLNQRRWEDSFEIRSRNEALGKDIAANAIKSGKRFLCTNISAAAARDLIQSGQVTHEECERVGVL